MRCIIAYKIITQKQGNHSNIGYSYITHGPLKYLGETIIYLINHPFIVQQEIGIYNTTVYLLLVIIVKSRIPQRTTK